MWQEVIIFILTAGSVWYLGRQFYRTAGTKKSGCGCGGCSSCSLNPKSVIMEIDRS